MPKSINERLAALEALEAPQPDPRVMELPPLSEDELARLIDAGLRSRDLFAGNGNPWFVGADPYWRAVAAQADDWYWRRYEDDPEHFTLHIPITPDEARLTRAGIDAGRVNLCGEESGGIWLDIASSYEIGTPLQSAVNAAKTALCTVYDHLRYYDESTGRYVMPMLLDRAAVCALLDEWSQDEPSATP